MSASPAFTSIEAPSVTFFDLDDDFSLVSTLNPAAPSFVPSFYPIADGTAEARKVDDILKTMHHLVGVYDSDMLAQSEAFCNADVPDDDVEEALWKEEALQSGLHTPRQKPKGVTYGRKSGRRERKSR